MRAIYLKNITQGSHIQITGDACHHLAMVVRLVVDEEVLVLNGEGRRIKCRAEQVSKKLILLKVLDDQAAKRPFHLDLALGIPKKEALELCLKQATELGINNIYLIRSEYSQITIPEIDRMVSLVVNALEQSNNPFLPSVLESTWDNIPWEDYGSIIMLDSQSNEDKSGDSLASHRNLLIIGPEGGFSPSELKYLRERQNLTAVHLPTPILRTPTALATGAGYFLRRLMDR